MHSMCLSSQKEEVSVHCCWAQGKSTVYMDRVDGKLACQSPPFLISFQILLSQESFAANVLVTLKGFSSSGKSLLKEVVLLWIGRIWWRTNHRRLVRIVFIPLGMHPATSQVTPSRKRQRGSVYFSNSLHETYYPCMHSSISYNCSHSTNTRLLPENVSLYVHAGSILLQGWRTNVFQLTLLLPHRPLFFSSSNTVEEKLATWSKIAAAWFTFRSPLTWSVNDCSKWGHKWLMES